MDKIAMYKEEIYKKANKYLSDNFKNISRWNDVIEDPEDLSGINRWMSEGSGGEKVTPLKNRDWAMLTADGGGNYYALNKRDKGVHFLDHERGYVPQGKPLYGSVRDFEKDIASQDLASKYRDESMKDRFRERKNTNILQKSEQVKKETKQNERLRNNLGIATGALGAGAGLAALARKTKPAIALGALTAGSAFGTGASQLAASSSRRKSKNLLEGLDRSEPSEILKKYKSPEEYAESRVKELWS